MKTGSRTDSDLGKEGLILRLACDLPTVEKLCWRRMICSVALPIHVSMDLKENAGIARFDDSNMCSGDLPS